MQCVDEKIISEGKRGGETNRKTLVIVSRSERICRAVEIKRDTVHQKTKTRWNVVLDKDC